MTEPWPRHAPVPASPRRLAPEIGSHSPLSQPLPAVRRDSLPDVAQVAEYPAVASLELPVVVAADLLAVERQGSDVYRF